MTSALTAPVHPWRHCCQCHQSCGVHPLLLGPPRGHTTVTRVVSTSPTNHVSWIDTILHTQLLYLSLSSVEVTKCIKHRRCDVCAQSGKCLWNEIQNSTYQCLSMQLGTDTHMQPNHGCTTYAVWHYTLSAKAYWQCLYTMIYGRQMCNIRWLVVSSLCACFLKGLRSTSLEALCPEF